MILKVALNVKYDTNKTPDTESMRQELACFIANKITDIIHNGLLTGETEASVEG